jgi:hypothetical protein
MRLDQHPHDPRRHHQAIEAQRTGRAGLITGHKKDVVVTNRLVSRPDCVAIYGWHRRDRRPIQAKTTTSATSA